MQKDLPTVAVIREEELVCRAQSGDRNAFTELLRQNQSSCQRLALSILRDPTAAEDEVQTAYTKAFEFLGSFQREARFSTWLNRIVANQCLMRLRRYQRARIVELDAVNEDGAKVELPSPYSNPEQDLGRREVELLIRKEVRRIPPLLRNVFLLREIEQLPMHEVARKLGISVAAAKSRLLRARSELRHRMQVHLGRMGLHSLTA